MVDVTATLFVLPNLLDVEWMIVLSKLQSLEEPLGVANFNVVGLVMFPPLSYLHQKNIHLLALLANHKEKNSE